MCGCSYDADVLVTVRKEEMGERGGGEGERAETFAQNLETFMGGNPYQLSSSDTRELVG